MSRPTASRTRASCSPGRSSRTLGLDRGLASPPPEAAFASLGPLRPPLKGEVRRKARLSFHLPQRGEVDPAQREAMRRIGWGAVHQIKANLPKTFVVKATGGHRMSIGRSP